LREHVAFGCLYIPATLLVLRPNERAAGEQLQVILIEVADGRELGFFASIVYSGKDDHPFRI
jgi:hypothetical protein